MTDIDLEAIKERNEPPGFHVDQDDVRALIAAYEAKCAEVERLRGLDTKGEMLASCRRCDVIIEYNAPIDLDRHSHKDQPFCQSCSRILFDETNRLRADNEELRAEISEQDIGIGKLNLCIDRLREEKS